MTLSQSIRLSELAAIGNEWFDHYASIHPIATGHPPSLKNPQKVKIPTAQDGWRKGDSRRSRDAAESDVLVLKDKMLRQIGKPTISRTADYPMYPQIVQSM
jgi:hypothetical protein